MSCPKGQTRAPVLNPRHVRLGPGRRPAPRPLKDLPQDSPTTFDYKLYPDEYVPPFHYKNPVTGR